MIRQVSACFEETDDIFSANLPNCNRFSPSILDGRCCQPQSLCVPGLYVSVFGGLLVRSAPASCQFRVTSPNETSRPPSERSSYLWIRVHFALLVGALLSVSCIRSFHLRVCYQQSQERKKGSPTPQHLAVSTEYGLIDKVRRIALAPLEYRLSDGIKHTRPTSYAVRKACGAVTSCYCAGPLALGLILNLKELDFRSLSLGLES